jgi:hypothetical protein
MPQLLVSLAVLTQRPPHTVWPVGHEHVPAMHDWPIAQTLPQRPQLLMSVLVATQRRSDAQ